MMTADTRNYTALGWGVLVLGLFLWLVSSQKFDFTSETPVPEISVADAAAAKARGAVVIDVRAHSAYEKGHITGAIAVPLEELRQRSGEFAAMKDKELVVYCGDGSNLGPQGTKVLNDAGRPDARNLTGGYSSWKAAGHPVATGLQR